MPEEPKKLFDNLICLYLLLFFNLRSDDDRLWHRGLRFNVLGLFLARTKWLEWKDRARWRRNESWCIDVGALLLSLHEIWEIGNSISFNEELVGKRLWDTVGAVACSQYWVLLSHSSLILSIRVLLNKWHDAAVLEIETVYWTRRLKDAKRVDGELVSLGLVSLNSQCLLRRHIVFL